MCSYKLYLPGVLLAFALAGLAIFLAGFSLLEKWHVSPAILAIIAGMLIGNSLYRRMAASCQSGVNFIKQKILRLAIILFGLKLTFQDIATVGIRGVCIDVLIITSTFAITVLLAQKWFRLDKNSALLIGSGCSICGAAAVMATESVIQDGTEKVAMAVATVVVFGTIAMFIYPLIYGFAAQKWGVSEAFFGIYTGSTIHEVAQVAAAGNAIGPTTENNAVITKMIRVLMLAPFLLILSWRLRGKNEDPTGQTRKIVIPWFAVGFIFMAILNSFPVLPVQLTNGLILLDQILMTAAMAALGLTTHISAFKKAGVKPLLLSAIMLFWLLFGGGAINFLILHYC